MQKSVSSCLEMTRLTFSLTTVERRGWKETNLFDYWPPENDQVSISMNTNSAYLLQQMLSGTRVGLHLSTESPCQVFVDTCSGLANKNAQKYLRHEGFGEKKATFTFFEAVKKVYNLAFFSFFVLKEFGKEQSTCY